MTEQSQMPLVGPPKRRGWREIVWFRPLTSSTHATLVVTRRGRLRGILPADSPRVLSDYLAWPYDFREVDTRERLLALEQRLESSDSGYEFCVSLRLGYQVVRAERVALELEDVQAELAHAIVQNVRLSGRSFGVEQDKAFEEHIQEILLYGEALVQRVQSLGLAVRRADVTVTLDDDARAHADALRFAMRERPLHFQITVESLEPDRSFDVLVGGAYRLIERRVQDGPGEATAGAIQMAIARTLQRVGITFAPSDYPNAAKAMAETLRKDALLQSELSMVQAQLLRPTVQIQPDRSMVHIPRPNPLAVPDMRPDRTLRRVRQALPRMGRRAALVDMSGSEQPREAPPPAGRRALPPPTQQPAEAARQEAGDWRLAAGSSKPPASSLQPLGVPGELPTSSHPIEGAHPAWPPADSMPAMRELPKPGQLDDEQDERAPWADLMAAANAASQDIPWRDAPPAPVGNSAEALPWDSPAAAGTAHSASEAPLEEHAPEWPITPAPTFLSEPAETPWESTAGDGSAQPPPEEQAPEWPITPAPTFLSEPAETPWESSILEAKPRVEEPAPQWPSVPALAFLSEPVEPLPWESTAGDGSAQPPPEEHAPEWPITPAPTFLSEPIGPPPEDNRAADTPDQPLPNTAREAEAAAMPSGDGADAVSDTDSAADAPIFSNSETSGELGFSLDWSDPERAPTAGSLADDLGFSLDWSEPPADQSALAAPGADPLPDDGIIVAHWDEQAVAPPEPPLFGDTRVEYASAGAVTADLDTPASDSEQAQSYAEQAAAQSLPAAAEQEEAHPPIEQEASPWYTPTLHLDDQQPIDTRAADVYPGSGAPGTGWAAESAPSSESASTLLSALLANAGADPSLDPPVTAIDDQTAAGSEPAGDAAVSAPEPPIVLGDPAWPTHEDQQPWQSAPASTTAADSTDQPSIDTIETSDDASAELPSEQSEPGIPESSQHIGADAEPVAEISSELIPRMIGLIQSYGPAWFKMWSLELKERPERLPVVLGEVTADPELLAHAENPQVQSALLLALAAYASPAMVPSRLPAPAPLPGSPLGGHSNDEVDEVPDWLSLRAKWNGHGGGG